MKYAGMIKQSLVDYPGKIAAVLFTRGCNFRCPYCHNSDLLVKTNRGETVDIEEILNYLELRKSFLDAVVISGGEPTLNEALIEDLQRIKEMGYLLKLDTNGSNCHMLEQLLERELLDYVAMDIKAPLDIKKYEEASGKITAQAFCDVRNSIHLLQQSSMEVEFRTTVVPVLHSYEDIADIARYIEGADLYSLQQFHPGHTLEPSFSALAPYSREEMEIIAEKCQPYVKRIRVLNI